MEMEREQHKEQAKMEDAKKKKTVEQIVMR